MFGFSVECLGCWDNRGMGEESCDNAGDVRQPPRPLIRRTPPASAIRFHGHNAVSNSF